MKRIITLFIVGLLAIPTFCQSTDKQMNQQALSVVNNKEARYVLFQTANYHIFIKLDTRTGRMWLVQFSTEKLSDSFEATLSTTNLVQTGDVEENGRFYLYPTTNIYTFILVDQISGPTYQVQWSTEPSNRGVLPIGTSH